MNHIIQTGTDSEGNAVTTTLDVQFTFTYEYAGHETQNFVNNQEMPRRRENDMVKTVSVKVTGTDSTTANASHLVDGQVDQTYSETFSIPLPWRSKANGQLSGFITPYENVTETIMLNWGKDILLEQGQVDAVKINFATILYGHRYHVPQ
jgi:hypothetical protein